jgi:hypothetical protein
MDFSRTLAPLDLDQSPQRNERPDALEQQKPPLSLVPREHGEHGQPAEIEDEVGTRALV